MKRRWMLPLAVLAVLAIVPTIDGAEKSGRGADPEVAMYHMYSGTDTLMLERCTRTRETVEGLMLVGKVLMQGYTMHLDDKALVTKLDLRLRPYPQLPDSAPMFIHAERRGRKVNVMHRDGGQRMNSMYDLDPEQQLGVSRSVAFLEQLVRRARSLGGDEVEIPIYLPGTRKNWNATVTKLTDDSVRVMLSAEEWRFKVDDDGRLLGGETVASKVKMRRLAVDGD